MKLPAGRVFALLLVTLFVVAGSSLVSGDEGDENRGLKIEIISPNDGEIFYASELGYIVSLPITGFVTGANGSPESVEIQLTIRSVHGETEPLLTRPDKNGQFAFYFDLNPDNEPLPSVGERFFYYSDQCGDCHFATNNILPLGPLTLEFTAATEDGEVATAEKRMTVDRSQYATIPVEVILVGENEASLGGIPVFAETRLYEWRGRRFMELTNDQGFAELDVEALSQRETRYLLSVPPTLIDDILYRSAETIEIVLPPGAAMAEPVKIPVIVESGVIAGSVAIDVNLSDGKALAIAQPSGKVYQTSIQVDNTFEFDELPLGEYLVSAILTEDASPSSMAQAEHVDLVDSVTADVMLLLGERPGLELTGQIIDEAGQPIPFGWLTVSDGSQSVQVSPLDGSFILSDIEDSQATINVTSPGFWSQSFMLADWVALSEETGQDITLIARTDNEEIEWGDGHILLPHESVIVGEEDTISLVRGWIWARNNQPEPITINMEGAIIEAEAADFALEYAPGEESWIYVRDGRVDYTSREGKTTEIVAGEMMAFGDGVPAPYPVAADEIAIELLRQGRKPTVPLLYEPEPSASQRAGDKLASVGRGLTQGLVAVTYLAMLLMIVGAILFGARRLLQARK
jgi:hypothetical protein